MKIRLVLVGAIASAAMLALPARAELGGDATSVQNDQSQLHAVRRVTQSNGYTVHELQMAGGIVVHEYATAQGKVFAVTWLGPFIPNLQQLLGNYFPAFKVAAAARHAAGVRGPVMVKQDDLVVRSSGHMRAYNGRAYVPSLIPPQVSLEEIQ